MTAEVQILPSKPKRKAKPKAEREPPRNTSYSDCQKQIVKLITELSHRYSLWQVFAGFVEMSALSIANAVDLGPKRDKREERYLQIAAKYRKEDLDKFPEMFSCLVMALEEGPSDVLGKTYHELELHNKWAGQYFTPWVVCQAMAKMNVEDGADLKAKIEAQGFVRAMEPSCGSAALMLALADAMKDAGVNYQQNLHVTAIDIDAKCVHMAYLQLSLLHIPACVVHGNALSLEEWDHWYTPAHIMGGWDRKLHKPAAIAEPATAVEPQVVEEPQSMEVLPNAEPVIELPLVAGAAIPVPQGSLQYTLF